MCIYWMGSSLYIYCILIRMRLEGTPEGEGLYLTFYTELSPDTDIISLLKIIMIHLCIVLQGIVLLEELILSIPLSWSAIFHSTLLREAI